MPVQQHALISPSASPPPSFTPSSLPPACRCLPARRAEQLVQAVLSAQGTEEGGDSEGALPTTTAANLHGAFASLVKEKYVERVPPCTLPRPPKEVSERRAGLAYLPQLCLAFLQV